MESPDPDASVTDKKMNPVNIVNHFCGITVGKFLKHLIGYNKKKKIEIDLIPERGSKHLI